jgi:hypothetical protein
MVRVNPLKPTDKICCRAAGRTLRYNCDGDDCTSFVHVRSNDARSVWSGCVDVLNALSNVVAVSKGTVELSDLLAQNV